MTVLSHDGLAVPLLDVGRDNGPLRDEILAAFARVYDSGRFLHGPDVRALEEEIAAAAGTRHAIGCASGSDALLLALMALGVGPGHEVIVPSFTFFATASAVTRLGARVVFADIEPDTFHLAPASLAAAITPRTRAVIPVHLFGQCAGMDQILEIAHRHGVAVVEDAAQAIGAAFQGRAAGSWGDVGCFSFYPTKNLGGCGDGGMLTTSNDALEQKLRLYAAHGMQPRYYHRVVGINSRLDSLQAAALRVKLKHLPAWTEARRANAKRYDRLLHDTGLGDWITLPARRPDGHHVWNQYTVRVHGGRRDEVRAFLARHDIGTEIYYPLPVHQQECFADLREGPQPESSRAASEVLNLPIFPGLREAELRTVVGRLTEFFAQHASAAA